MPVVLRVDGFDFLFFSDEGMSRHISTSEMRAAWPSFGSIQLRSRIAALTMIVRSGRSKGWSVSIKTNSGKLGTSSFPGVRRPSDACATLVAVSDDRLTMHLDDSRVVSVPLSWFPLLAGQPQSTPRLRAHRRRPSYPLA